MVLGEVERTRKSLHNIFSVVYFNKQVVALYVCDIHEQQPSGIMKTYGKVNIGIKQGV